MPDAIDVTVPDDVLFVGVLAVKRDLVVVPAYLTALEDTELRYTSVFRLRGESWGAGAIKESVVAMASRPDASEVLFLCRGGDIYRFDATGMTLEGDLGSGLGLLRHIGDHYYVGGTRGRILRREADTTWTPLSVLDVLPGRDEAGRAVLLEDLCGVSEDEMWAVGLSGAMFTFDGERWRRVDVPTQRHLRRLTVTPDGDVYAAGAQGILLRLDDDEWRVVCDAGAGVSDIWGLEWVAGALYASTMSGLYRLDGSRLVRIGVSPTIGPDGLRVFDDGPQSGDESDARFLADTHYLSAADGVLWSVGDQAIWRFDGAHWNRVRHPLPRTPVA